jgi:hypothetical protein
MYKFMIQIDQYSLASWIHSCITQRKLAVLGWHPAWVNEFAPLDKYEVCNLIDGEETPKEIEEEWSNDDEMRIKGNLVYTLVSTSKGKSGVHSGLNAGGQARKPASADKNNSPMITQTNSNAMPEKLSSYLPTLHCLSTRHTGRHVLQLWGQPNLTQARAV